MKVMVFLIIPAAIVLYILFSLPRISREMNRQKSKMTKEDFTNTYCVHCGYWDCGGVDSIYSCNCKYLPNFDVED